MKELHLAEGTVRHEKRVAVGTLFWKVGCMTIEKVINNNIVSAFDEIGREVVVMGCGIGFGSRPGAKIPEDKIEKIFRIESGSVADQFKELLAGVPLEHAKISSDIISYAKGALKLKLNQSIYVTLTDHINFAIERVSQGIEPQNALLYGIFTVVTVLLGFRAGFSFSAGATDLLFSASLPAAQKTWLIIPLGIAAFIVFYVVFKFAILKFDLKTPGREDDADETTVKLANDNFTEVAKIILEGIGGKENVASIDNCITRLRLEIKDYTAVDEKKIKSAGVAGVIRPGKNSVQVVIGTKVQFVADEFKKLCK